MGRPSKLTPQQWERIAERMSRGERLTDLAREFKVSKASISQRVSKLAQKRTERIEGVANQLVTAETALRSLTVSEQAQALELRTRLMSISQHIAAAADNNSAVAHRLSALAATTVQKIDDAQPLETVKELKTVSALLRVANEAAHIPMNLLAANKEATKNLEKPDVPAGLGHFYGDEAEADA